MTPLSVSGKSLVQYGFIGLPVAFAGFPLYVLAPDYYATHHGLSLTLLGTLLLVIRLFDAIQDPLIGWMTDRLHGRFLSVLAVAGAVLCLAIFGLFNLTLLTPAVWFALCMLISVSAYSVMTIILGARATLWTSDKNDQTRIAGARESFGLIGLVVAVSLPTLLSQVSKPDGIYVWYFLLLATLMFAGIVSFSKLPKVQRATETSSVSLLAGLRAVPPDTLRLLVVYGLSMLASSLPAVLVIFFVRDLLGAESLTGLFLLLYFLSGAAGMPLWKSVSARVGKYKAWALSNIIAVAGFIGAFFLGAGDIWTYAAVCLVSGLALGADLTLPPSILADQIHERGNAAFSATHYAILAFCAKASLALASAISLPVLDAAGFKPQTENSKDALMVLSVAYALIPCALKLAAAALLHNSFIHTRPGGGHDVLQSYGDTRSSRHA
jgi:glycoside/pentoside/hexuronide:cation symporter, GPH family